MRGALALLFLASLVSVGSSVLRGSADTVPASRAVAAAGKGAAKAVPLASRESEDVAPPAGVSADLGSEDYASEEAAPPPPAPSPSRQPKAVPGKKGGKAAPSPSRAP